jgi:iron complex transport system ATP-binding protein
MTTLQASGIVVRRGGRAVIDSVALTAASGDFIAVVGPNGAGKSTLLSVLAGLLVPDAGAVRLDGKDLSAIGGAALAKTRAYLPQNPRCEWPIAVERLVALGLNPSLPVFGGLPAGFAHRISEVLAMCDLVGHRGQPATTLSGGELGRAMLARAFVGDPDILIVDEPMAGLDPRHALEMAARLQAFSREGKIVIAAIHDLSLAARYATRVFALKSGQVAGDGPFAETLTPELVRSVFGVEVSIERQDGRVLVDYRHPV